ncbi:radical SAM protein [Pelosinus fermentans]|uniref:Radical SAM domain protein n=1 Tax=Pelosinus fermentans JBW45 TaxID=1192197 RepID=I9NR82_9FIRM|nr:radical SAM protein [Pelosinus fermentans]AJQ26620.1 Radical SAM domain protein [Pelosinus fermentans JBW45]
MIDCLFIGHNEMDLTKNRQLLRLKYGHNSHNYTETNKFNLGYIKYKGKLHTPIHIYNALKSESVNRASAGSANIGEIFSLTIAYLASYLHKRGFSFDYINSFNEDRNLLVQKLQENNIRTIIIPTTYYLSPIPIVEIMQTVKKYNNTAKVIIGGPFIFNQVRDLCNQEMQKLLTRIGADIYIYSIEGEEALARTISAVKNGLSLNNINNVIYNHAGVYQFTSVQKEENSLDENPVNWKLFSESLNSNINIRTSNSCLFSCAFCSFPKSSGKYRIANLETVENELNMLRDIGNVTAISFIDDTFNFPPDRLKNMLRMMIKNKYKFKWNSFFRCQHADQEMIELMQESGCIQVFCGIESGNQQILNNINKKTSLDKYEEVLEMLHKHNIMTVASFIVGFPGETHDTYFDTFNFIERTKPTFFRARLWWYDNNAPIYEHREKFKLVGKDYEWSHETMDSNTAQGLADNMLLSIKNSTHVADYPIPFDLVNKGLSKERVVDFMKAFNMSVREVLLNKYQIKENPKIIEKLRRIIVG